MSKAGFIEFFERDLTALEKEITSYTDEKTFGSFPNTLKILQEIFACM